MPSRLLICALAAVTLAQAPPRDALPRRTGTAVISGRVVDANTGRPLRRAVVSLGGIAWDSISTNSQGRFEFRDLAPARYTLHVHRDGYIEAQYGQRHFSEPGRPLEVSAGEQVDAGVFRLFKKSIISGYVTDDTGDPIANIEIMPLQYKYFHGRRRFVLAPANPTSTDTTGYFRISGLLPGEYQLLASTRETWTIEEDGVQHVIAYAPTHYPGITSGGSVQSIRIEAGKDVANISFALTAGRHATITGTALNSRGEPLAGQTVHPTQEFRGPTRSVMMSLPAAAIESDGSFVIRNVPPGEYLLRVAVVNTSRFPTDPPATPPRPPPPLPERSRVRVSVAGDDIHGVVIRTSPAVMASGRAESDDGVALPDAVRAVRVVAQPADDVDTELHAAPESGRILDDGSFEVGPLFGKYRFTTPPLPQGWAVQSVLQGFDDLSVTPVEVYGPSRLTGLRLILTNRTATIGGTIVGPDARPADGSVLIFSTQRDRWFEESRFVRHARPDQSGRLSIRGLLPGEYYAVALPFVEDGQWNDPEYLDGLTRTAVRIALGEREEREMSFVVR